MRGASTRRERTRPSDGEPESQFERFPWVYALCQDRLFRDDTKLKANAHWPGGVPAAGNSLPVLGCGLGFYSRSWLGSMAAFGSSALTSRVGSSAEPAPWPQTRSWTTPSS